LLQRHAGDGAERRRQPDQRGGAGLDVSVEPVGDSARGCGDPDRRERRSGRSSGAEADPSDQQRHDDDPATDTEECAEDTGHEADREQAHHSSYRMAVAAETLLEALAASPAEAAILLDVDGTLAPIVARPELAGVPEETRAELRRLVGRYALVGCISGRTGADAARVVGIDGPVYVGVHGLELAPEAERWRGPLREFAESVDWPVEDKGLAIVFHYREAKDEEAALAVLRGVAERATALGLEAQFGRKMLEVRPPVAADKGTAVRALLKQRGLRRALYAGDDTTDLDAFRGLDGLDVSVRIAVASAEGPPALVEAADLVVAGPAELVELLRRL
jgi:trehalose 6-phosphate phosphatase